MSALFALVAAIGWGSSDFAAGYASRKSSAISVVILTHFAAVIALFCFGFDFSPVWTMLGDLVSTIASGGGADPIRWGGPAVVGSPTAADVGWGVAAGLGGGFGAMLLFRGLGKGSMAVVAPITAAGAATIPVLFGLLTGDPVTIIGVAGIALALFAIVLVSLGGEDHLSLDELTVPDAWSTQFRLPPPTVPLDPSAGPSTSTSTPTPTQGSSVALLAPPATAVATMAPPAPAVASDPAETPLATPAIEMLQSPTSRLDDDELQMPVRSIRRAVLALVATAVLSAAAIASQPIGALLDGEEFTGGVASTLVFALVIVGLAAFALNGVKPLFDFTDLGSLRNTTPDVDVAIDGADPTAGPTALAPASVLAPAGRATSPAPTTRSWKAIVRQPGVAEALMSGVGFGLFFVFIYRASEAAGLWPLVGARTVSVVMFVIIALATSTAVLPERPSRRAVVLAGLLDANAAIFFVLSTRVGLLSVGAVIAALYPVATVVLARVITKERIRPRQMVGLVVALCAVGLLAL